LLVPEAQEMLPMVYSEVEEVINLDFSLFPFTIKVSVENDGLAGK